MTPLVSCICPTAGRREFLRAAIGHFLAQDYPRKQLVIVEDGDERNSDLVPPAPAMVEHCHLGGGRRSIGEKRNIAAGIAAGEWIAHWDDDDWHAPTRLSRQMAAAEAAGAAVCGADRLVFFDGRRAWLYQSRRSPWLAGGTLLYRRAVWAARPFAAQSSGEDTLFVDALARDGVSVVLADPALYVAMIHPGNSDPDRRPDHQWVAIDPDEIRRRIAPAKGAA